MISSARTSVVSRLLERLNLRFPTLFLLFAVFTLADLLIPDLIPFVDEIVMALATAVFGMWKKKKSEETWEP